MRERPFLIRWLRAQPRTACAAPLFPERLELTHLWRTFSPLLLRRIRPWPPTRPAAATGCSQCASMWEIAAFLSSCGCVVYLWLFLFVCTINYFALFESLVAAVEDLGWGSQTRPKVRATAQRSERDDRRRTCCVWFTLSAFCGLSTKDGGLRWELQSLCLAKLN